MGKAITVSVRMLVEFSVVYPDITPTRDTQNMAEGMRAHKGRQKEQYEGFETEVPVKHTLECGGASVTVHGRMDAYRSGEVPLIEEIKRSDSYIALDAPSEAHRLQAVCYGALLSLESGIEMARIRVMYVDGEGAPLRSFETDMSAEEMLKELYALLKPYVAFMLTEIEHRERRDESIKQLPFPYDNYRAGQREMAVQVYTAITKRKRLFASLPTGTGKSAAVLYPALKAMGEGRTGKILYLTARTTTRQSPLSALEMMMGKGLRARVMTQSAKEKLCPEVARCHPDDCPRAKGHFLRQGAGIDEIRRIDGIWTDDVILDVANRHMLCPFEFSLSLIMLSDVAMLDYNYAFDPLIRIQRLFQRRRDITLLIDEAHHLLERSRDSLSGEMDSRHICEVRRAYSAEFLRKSKLYAAMTAVIKALRALPLPEGERECELEGPPEGIGKLIEDMTWEISETVMRPMSSELRRQMIFMLRFCFPMLYALEAYDDSYATLLTSSGKERRLELYCLLPAEQLERMTHGLRGCVYFSATLAPLGAMKELLGGSEDDACFSLPSPFPKENLSVVRKYIDTRYRFRADTARAVAEAIRETFNVRKGKYIAFFPSYAYLDIVKDELGDLPITIQRSDMEDEGREEFLKLFTDDGEPLLGLCVLGGSFAEGIDLPGERLVGVIVVSVGLPTPSLRQNVTRRYYDERFGDGFSYACRYPAMQKVCQAAGRLIRSESDRGIITLIDTRYFNNDYLSLLPPEWDIITESIDAAAKKITEVLK